MSLISWIALILVILLAAGAVFAVTVNKKNSKDTGCGFDCTSCVHRRGKEKEKNTKG